MACAILWEGISDLLIANILASLGDCVLPAPPAVPAELALVPPLFPAMITPLELVT